MTVPLLITELSTTAANNFPTGSSSPAVLDDVQRAHASFIAKLRDEHPNISAIQAQTHTAFTTTGTAAAVAITPVPAITAYAAGQSWWVTFSIAPTVNATFAVNGIATPPQLVKRAQDGTYVNIATGDILANHRTRVTQLSATQAWVEDLSVLRQGTTAQFNAALTDNDFATLAGVEAFTGAKTFSAATTMAAVSATTLTASGNTKIRATRGTAQSIPNNADTILIYATEVFDTGAEYDPATGRATITNAGYYQIHGQSTSASAAWDAGEYWQCNLFVNGTLVVQGARTFAAAAGAFYMYSEVNALLLLTAADIVDIRIIHNQGAAVDVFPYPPHNQFSINRVA